MAALISKSKGAMNLVRAEVAAIVFAKTHRHFPRVLANSMPKAGTNLQIRLLTLLDFHRHGHIDIGPNDGLQCISMEHVQQARDFLARIRPGHFSSSHCYFFPDLLPSLMKPRLRL